MGLNAAFLGANSRSKDNAFSINEDNEFQRSCKEVNLPKTH